MTTLPQGMSHLNLWITHPRSGNPLRHFMAWRKLSRSPGSFAYACVDTTLHRDLSIADNFLLSMGGPSMELAEDYEKTTYLKKALEKEGLLGLASWFALSCPLPINMSPQEKAIASICCALLNRADQTLINLSGMHLEGVCLAQLKQVLSQSRRTVFVATDDAGLWQSTPHKIFDPKLATVVIKKTA